MDNNINKIIESITELNIITKELVRTTQDFKENYSNREKLYQKLILIAVIILGVAIIALAGINIYCTYESYNYDGFPLPNITNEQYQVR